MMFDKHELYFCKRLLPLKVSIIYIAATFGLSIIGPIRYYDNAYKYWIVLPFILGVCFCLSIGYFFGCRSLNKTEIYYNDYSIIQRENRLLAFSLKLSIFSLMLELIYIIRLGHFSLNLFKLGILYNTRIEDNSNTVIFVRFICSSFRVAANCLGIYKFKDLSKIQKRLVILNIFLYFLVFLFGYGNQKGASDVVIYLSIAIYVSRIKSGQRVSKKSLRIIILVLVLSFFLFSYMQYLRYAPRGINASNFHLYATGEYYFDTNHIVFKLFGDKLGFGMAGILSGYLSQGYYGLSLCMQLPFKWTYGIGSSYALTKLLEKIGIEGIFERTYLSRMSRNFSRNGLSAWNTIFPWLASDFTWIGAALFFIFVGYFMAKAWKEIILNDNIISYIVFCITMILILFIPANNQVFHGYDSFISSWSFIIIWLFGRKKYMHES